MWTYSRGLASGLILGLLAVGCAGFTFKYYGLAAVSYDGTLLGPSADKDVPFSRCAPTEADKGPCVIMFTSEFFALKTDYQNLKAQLKECQSTRP